MSKFGHILMSDRLLARDFAFGPLQFTNADSFPLNEMFSSASDGELTLTLMKTFPAESPWHGNSVVEISMSQLPEGEAKFTGKVNAFRQYKPRSGVIPDDQPINDTVLALSNVSDDWEHDFFARDSHDLFHIYRSKQCGVLIRWCSKQGPILHDPLFSVVGDNLRLVSNQWQATAPPTRLFESERAGFQSFLDLRIEQERVRRFIEGQIQAYPNRKNIGPGEPGNPISQITLGFYAAQGGNVWLVFDTRVDSEPDGEWTLYLRDSNELCVPEWDGFYSAAFEDESVTIITHDGREVVITEETVSEDLLNELFGEMLADLLRQLRAEGVFSELPLQPGATFDASELCGFYCWPGSDLPRETGLVSR